MELPDPEPDPLKLGIKVSFSVYVIYPGEFSHCSGYLITAFRNEVKKLLLGPCGIPAK